MTTPHKSPPLALTLRGHIKHAPENWRAHMAAAADQVEECAKLSAELAASRKLLIEIQWGNSGFCPLCAGWGMPEGELRGRHTDNCALHAALAKETK